MCCVFQNSFNSIATSNGSIGLIYQPIPHSSFNHDGFIPSEDSSSSSSPSPLEDFFPFFYEPFVRGGIVTTCSRESSRHAAVKISLVKSQREKKKRKKKKKGKRRNNNWSSPYSRYICSTFKNKKGKKNTQGDCDRQHENRFSRVPRPLGQQTHKKQASGIPCSLFQLIFL